MKLFSVVVALAFVCAVKAEPELELLHLDEFIIHQPPVSDMPEPEPEPEPELPPWPTTEYPPSIGPVCGEGQIQSWPDMVNCRRFHLCYDESLYHMWCAPGRNYDYRVRKCLTNGECFPGAVHFGDEKNLGEEHEEHVEHYEHEIEVYEPFEEEQMFQPYH